MSKKEAQIYCDEDCGNAPKKKVIMDFITAIARNDQKHIAEAISDKIVWHIVGDQTISGGEAFMKHVFSHAPISEVHIDHIVTNKNKGAADGTIVYEGNRAPSLSFCHVYQFSSGKQSKIKAIHTYYITNQ